MEEHLTKMSLIGWMGHSVLLSADLGFHLGSQESPPSRIKNINTVQLNCVKYRPSVVNSQGPDYNYPGGNWGILFNLKNISN